MKTLLFSLISSVLTVFAAAATIEGEVLRVVDGVTLIVQIGDFIHASCETMALNYVSPP